MAGFAPNPQKAVFQAAALQEVLELLHDIRRQRLALQCQLFPERGPMLLDQLVEQRYLWTMAIIPERRKRPDFIL